jgi:hypothetical protein
LHDRFPAIQVDAKWTYWIGRKFASRRSGNLDIREPAAKLSHEHPPDRFAALDRSSHPPGRVDHSPLFNEVHDGHAAGKVFLIFVAAASARLGGFFMATSLGLAAQPAKTKETPSARNSDFMMPPLREKSTRQAPELKMWFWVAGTYAVSPLLIIRCTIGHSAKTGSKVFPGEISARSVRKRTGHLAHLRAMRIKVGCASPWPSVAIHHRPTSFQVRP